MTDDRLCGAKASGHHVGTCHVVATPVLFGGPGWPSLFGFYLESAPKVAGLSDRFSSAFFFHPLANGAVERVGVWADCSNSYRRRDACREVYLLSPSGAEYVRDRG
jgi:hypothetical protein